MKHVLCFFGRHDWVRPMANWVRVVCRRCGVDRPYLGEPEAHPPNVVRK